MNQTFCQNCSRVVSDMYGAVRPCPCLSEPTQFALSDLSAACQGGDLLSSDPCPCEWCEGERFDVLVGRDRLFVRERPHQLKLLTMAEVGRPHAAVGKVVVKQAGPFLAAHALWVGFLRRG